MRNLLLGIIALTIGLAASRPDPTTEPPLRFELSLDGQKHQLVEGKPLEIRVGEREIEARIDVHPHRHFDAAGVQFDYPRAMTFEYEPSPEDGHWLWTVDSPDLMILVNQFEEGDADELARQMAIMTAMGIDDQKPKVKTDKVVWGGQRYRCHRTTANLDDITFHMASVGFIAKGQPIVLMLQELREQGTAAPSATTSQILELLAKTLKVDPQ